MTSAILSSLFESQNYVIHQLDAKMLQICKFSKCGRKDKIYLKIWQFNTSIKMSTKMHSMTFLSVKKLSP